MAIDRTDDRWLVTDLMTGDRTGDVTGGRINDMTDDRTGKWLRDRLSER